MTTRLIIARHGNTFDKGETPLRVGARTDLPLSNSGRAQGTLMGRYFIKECLRIDKVFTSNLKRTYETAEIALNESGQSPNLEKLDIFNEVDYGPDEAKTEEEVIARIGQEALDEWDRIAKVPDGWKFDPKQAIENWKSFAENLEKKYKNQTTLVVTSNGIARFAPYLTGDFEQFSKDFKIKISTGALCFLEKEEGDKNWKVTAWNIRPKDFVEE